MDGLRDRLGIHAFEDFQSLLGRVAHHKAVGALVYVLLEFGQFRGIQGFFQVTAELSQKLLTGKQTRRPPFF